jgi:hypothetical protein
MPDERWIAFFQVLLASCLWSAMGAAGCNHATSASSTPESIPPQVSMGPRNETAVIPATEIQAETADDNREPPVASPQPPRPAASVPPANPPKAVNRPPRADRMPTRPGDAEKITFDDLNLQMLANIVFRPFMVTDRVKELEGKRVSISGYMHGGAAGSSGIKKFVLLKNTECKFGKDGQADHLAMIYLKSGTTADYTRSDVKVEGTLKIEPFTGDDGNTWSIYNLEDAQIR